MNVVTRGMRSAFRSPLRSGAIIIMLAISIALVVAMLVARSSVNAKIDEVKASTANVISISPAGIQGGFGGGDPLTAEQLKTIKSTSHVASTVGTLTDQAGTDDTSLAPSLELGSFGQRMQRFESSDGGQTSSTMPDMGEASDESRPAPQARTTVTGTTNVNSVSTDGSELTLTSGETINGSSSAYEALVGKALAEKNSLTVGKTFTLYEKTFTVKGIYETGNTFQDGGIIVPLVTLQTLTDQAGALTSVTATVDSTENVSATVTSLKSALGDAADITSESERAQESTESLSSIASLALTGVIGSTIAGAVIVLLTMTMIVRERRREIGVIKAIGGTTTKVVGQFTTEALTLTLIGGIIGIIAGVFISGGITSSLVSSSSNTQQPGQGGPTLNASMRVGPGGAGGQFTRGVTDITSTVTPDVFIIATITTLLIATIGSAVPAYLISRVRPAEVLRAE